MSPFLWLMSKTIKAHKYYLAAVSPVFRKLFFGPLLVEREVVEVEWSRVAFQKMIQFIYKPPGNFTMDNANVMFEVFAVADYYKILGLCEHEEHLHASC